MFSILFGVFIVLHGLVHLWFFTLSQGLIELKPDMPDVGWTGKSWLFTSILGDATTRGLASGLYIVATIGFVIGGIGIFGQQEWARMVLVASAALSAAVIILFWDGGLQLVVQKGLIGLLISLAILLALLGPWRSAAAF